MPGVPSPLCRRGGVAKERAGYTICPFHHVIPKIFSSTKPAFVYEVVRLRKFVYERLSMMKSILIDFLIFFLCFCLLALILGDTVLNIIVVCIPVLLMSIYSDLSGKGVPAHIYILVILAHAFIILPALGI